jgi:TM2 domain-containing membrane protein YozV
MTSPTNQGNQKKQKTTDEKYCNSCGEVINKEAEICPKCGVRQQSAPSTHSSTSTKTIKSKTVAGVLAILLGGIGVHKFYLGNVGVGIIYLIFAWTFIPEIIGIVEGIIYLTFSGTDEEFTAKYSR